MSRFGSLPRRLVHLVIVLFGITLVTFFLLRLIPGDPALAILGSSYTHTRAVAIDNFLGLNKPIWTQYGLFMGRLFHGNLGFSFFYDEPATTVIGQHIAPTLFLVVYSAVLAALISFPIGFAAGLHRGGVIDQSSRIFFTLSFAMPAFWLGIIWIQQFVQSSLNSVNSLTGAGGLGGLLKPRGGVVRVLLLPTGSRQGEVVLELFEDQAPITVANFLSLAAQKQYDGTRFYRTESAIMAEGGDVKSRDRDPCVSIKGQIVDDLDHAALPRNSRQVPRNPLGHIVARCDRLGHNLVRSCDAEANPIHG